MPSKARGVLGKRSDRLTVIGPSCTLCEGKRLVCDAGSEGTPREIAIYLPDDVAARLQAEQPDISRHVLESLALALYQSGELNEEQIRRLLGYNTLLKVHAFLAEYGVPLRYTLEDLEHDRAAHDRLGI
jgi:Uncharacterised protein family (UPF0175)